MGIERLVHSTAEDLRGGSRKKLQDTMTQVSLQTESFWVWAPTTAAQATFRDLQKRTNLSNPAMEVYLSILKLQTWLLGFTHTATPPSEDAFIPVCRSWVALPRTALHPASTNHCEKWDVNYTNCTAVHERDLPYRRILVAWSYIFLLPLLPLSAHRLPRLQPLFSAAPLPPQPLHKLPTPFPPCTGGSADGSSSSRSS